MPWSELQHFEFLNYLAYVCQEYNIWFIDTKQKTNFSSRMDSWKILASEHAFKQELPVYLQEIRSLYKPSYSADDVNYGNTVF